MRTHVHQSAQLGELVVAAFDEAAHYSTDPREVSRLATQAVGHMLRGARRSAISLSRPKMPARRAPSVDGGQAEIMRVEKHVVEIRDASCRLLSSRPCVSDSSTDGECCGQSDCSQERW